MTTTGTKKTLKKKTSFSNELNDLCVEAVMRKMSFRATCNVVDVTPNRCGIN